MTGSDFVARGAAVLLLAGSLAAGAAERASRDCDGCPELVEVPAGTFVMGAPADDALRWDDEGPQRRVAVAAFALARHHVTRGQYAAFVKETHRPVTGGCSVIAGTRYEVDPRRSWRDPGFPQTDRDPVVCVSFVDAHAYAAWLNRKVGREIYRLPTEAEFEYAARAGRTSEPWGRRQEDACRYANVGDRVMQAQVLDTASWEVFPCRDGFAYTSPVGKFPPNAFGLHDMIGNARQHVADCYRESYVGAPLDAAAWLDSPCEKHGARGGSWSSIPRYARLAKRFRFFPDDRYVNLGFRVARSL